MTDHMNQDDRTGQSGIDAETQLRNQENEAGQQSQSQFGSQGQDQPSQVGQADYGSAGQQADKTGSFDQQSNTTIADKTDYETPTEPTTGQTGFVGSDGDQSSDYLTKGENEDFQPEDLTSSDTSTGTADVETGQPTSPDATLDDGADTSR